ncbi:spiroplasma phage ORF1-like family protein, partial [Spiroplasma phoeniceum]|uniref:spiroplasma phage ORF1-like family protein n=1 Tax=Spiroplasma phoeniceum TaxID=47835 RepID=UPI003364C0BA
MRKRILSFFLVLLIPFGWIFLFNGTISIKKDNFFKILFRSIFVFDDSFIKFSSEDFGFSFFVKNGFLLYPKALYFNLKGAGHDDYFSSPIVRFYNAYKVDVKNFSYYFYSNWNTETDKLQSMYDVFSKIKMLDMTNSDKYKGFNVFEFISTKLTAGNSVEIHGFNFSIYNVKDWQNEIKGGKIWQLSYLDAPWYRLDKHIINALIWAFNTLPGIKEVVKYINALGNTMHNVNL